jgi:hypothetical protein
MVSGRTLSHGHGIALETTIGNASICPIPQIKSTLGTYVIPYHKSPVKMGIPGKPRSPLRLFREMNTCIVAEDEQLPDERVFSGASSPPRYVRRAGPEPGGLPARRQTPNAANFKDESGKGNRSPCIKPSCTEVAPGAFPGSRRSRINGGLPGCRVLIFDIYEMVFRPSPGLAILYFHGMDETSHAKDRRISIGL